MNSRFRPDIEGLRALAVLPILVFHLDPLLCPGGFVGVDIFFVVSGFLISGLILEQGEAFSARRFYLRRVLRLFPALLVTLLVTLCAGWKYLGPAEYVQLAKSAIAAGLGVSNFFFVASFDNFQPAAASQPLLHTWSLGLEEQVYLFWPLLLVLAMRRQKVGFAIAAAGFFSFVLVQAAQGLYPQAAFYLMPFRLFEFALGAFVVVLRPSLVRRSPAVCSGLGTAALVVIGASFVVFDAATPWPGMAALAPSIATAVLLGVGDRGAWNWILSLAPLRFIGRISYSVYLVHWPLIVFYRGYTITSAGWAEIILLGCLSIGLGSLLYLGVERTFRITSNESTRTALQPLAFQRAHRLLGISLLALVLGVGSLATVKTGGFPSRLDRGRIQLLDKGLSYAGDVCDQRHARCTFGSKDSDRVVYLIGDSHALNLVHGLDLLFREANIRGVALYDHGCLFAYGSARFISGVRDKTCARNVQKTYEYLAANRHPVILAGDYSGYVNEIGPSEANAPHRHDEAQYFAWLDARFEESLQLLNPSERPVVLVKQTYSTEVDMPKCMAQPNITPENSVARCPIPPLGRARTVSAGADALIDRLSFRFPTVTVVDPKAHFCANGEQCLVFAPDGSFYFRDATHLTNEGSLFLVGRLREVLLAALLR